MFKSRGCITIDDRIDPIRLAEGLADALRRVRAKNVKTAKTSVTFDVGAFRFVSNWNVLNPFSRGELVINRLAKKLEYNVHYRFLIRLMIYIIFAFIGMRIAKFPPELLYTFPMMITILFLMSNLIGRWRLESFLRETVELTANNRIA